jgi:hypothetical protein
VLCRWPGCISDHNLSYSPSHQLLFNPVVLLLQVVHDVSHLTSSCCSTLPYGVGLHHALSTCLPACSAPTAAAGDA